MQGNLHRSVTEDVLQSIFSVIGPIGDVKVVRDRLSNQSAGYGFVKFAAYGADPQAAQRALAIGYLLCVSH